jgi:hypothetical protein
MEDLLIKQTQQTPKVEFLVNGDLLIEGISLPSNVNEFYDVVNDWIDQLGNRLPPKIHLTLHFEYFNTSSSLTIHGLLKKLVSFSKKGVPLTITWIYDEDDRDMYDEGVLFQNRIDFPFSFSTTQ